MALLASTLDLLTIATTSIKTANSSVIAKCELCIRLAAAIRGKYINAARGVISRYKYNTIASRRIGVNVSAIKKLLTHEIYVKAKIMMKPVV